MSVLLKILIACLLLPCISHAAGEFGAVDVAFDDGSAPVHFEPEKIATNKHYQPHKAGAAKRYLVGWQRMTAGQKSDDSIAVRMNSSADGAPPFSFMFLIVQDGKTRNYSAGCSVDVHYLEPCNEANQGITLDLERGVVSFRNVSFNRDSTHIEHEEHVVITGTLRIVGTPVEE